MNYLKITNKGVLPQALFTLMGASTKTGESQYIGEFGTGLKYAVAYFMRTQTPLKVFLGNKELSFSTKTRNLKGKHFDCIYINDKSTNLTTQFGSNWEAWMAIREVWCNAIDEQKHGLEEVKEDSSGFKFGQGGYTTFLIGITEEIQKVVDHWDDYFLTRTDSLYDTPKIAIYPSKGETLKVYKKGVLIYHRDQKCLFHYDIRNAEINELREYRGSLSSDVAEELISSNHRVVEDLRKGLDESLRNKKNEYPIEADLDYEAWYLNEQEEAKINQLWTGKLYISTRSSFESKHGIMVPDTLLGTLDKCGLKTKTVQYAHGYGYSGVIHSDWEYVPHPNLQERITRIVDSLGINIATDTMVAINGNNPDFVYKSGKIIFNVDLQNKDDRELTSIVVSAFILDRDSKYVVMKRLIKSLVSNKSRLKKILGI